MVHEDAGHYGAKHPNGKIDDAIADKIRSKDNQGRITCAAAHEIARQYGCSPIQVGKNIDLLEKRINKCQLGLFGYGTQQGKAVEASATVPQDLETAIRHAVDGDRISCKAAWDVAIQSDVTRMDVACACEALGIKVSSCQLGAF